MGFEVMYQILFNHHGIFQLVSLTCNRPGCIIISMRAIYVLLVVILLSLAGFVCHAAIGNDRERG